MGSRLSTALSLCWLAAATGGLASCVSFQWTRLEVHEPIPEELSEGLEPGTDTLESCLGRLGAPLYVWEVNSTSFALAYGWNDGRDWGFKVSVPIYRAASGSFQYGDANLDLHGLVLVFDSAERLLRTERGYLRDIAPELAERRRPALVEDGEGDGEGPSS